ncbi:MAG: Rrf2 family transcriptional regulator [Eubacterium sp.]|nr:Rrf2 family transcriptional regulator [Eubacterium sp.]
MRISTKGRYALRMMLDLGLHNTGKPIRVKEIAARQEISDKYLEQIVAVLNKAGYVRSVRGPQGGYLLTRPAEEYTVGMILRLTEGSLAPVECLDDMGECDKSDDCITLLVYQKMNEAVNNVIDHITLADLIGWKLQKEGDYSI